MDRRGILKAGLGVSALFSPLPYARVWAQSEGAVKLLRLPKIALVIGNSKYKDAPLKNPANDAGAIGEALKAAGFAVTAKLDASRADMAAAIDAYAKELAAKKCVGIFYYAGHGIQLQWKNYMLPVDAEVDTVDDVQKKAVEVNSLMEGLTRAANPLNVVILDACRDNPFGTAKPTQAKGLSQMDAPNHTLLAYATAPGNVASDGEGANGLYTENLLREIKVPEAKLEDVFKRVRLGVRRKSNGAQVPWESTSLEDDFWFIPPKELKKLSDSERERLFKEELELWERAKKAAEPAAFEEYLRRYPSGDFSELAQSQLDRLLARQGEKKVQIAASEGNPFTKGSAAADVNYKVGDTYVMRSSDMISKAVQPDKLVVVERVTEDAVYYSDGLITDLLGNTRRFPDGRTWNDNQQVPVEFAVGKHWVTRFFGKSPQGVDFWTEITWRIVTREPVTVPAGTFNAFRIEGQVFSAPNFAPPGRGKNVYWYDPARLRLPVRREVFYARGGPNPLIQRSERIELVSFKQA